MTPVLRLDQVTKAYGAGDSAFWALKGVSFDIYEGEMVALMGPSGSGKTTLMNIIGILDRQSDGHYLLGGEDVTDLNEKRRAEVRNRTIGFVFQAFHLLPRLSVLENVEVPLTYAGYAPRVRRARALDMLDKVGLSDKTRSRPTQLSGGQKQRVAIARALAMNPSLILADEPTGNLDTATGDEILTLFQELNAEGVTLLIVTHEASVASRTRRALRLRDGPPRERRPASGAGGMSASRGGEALHEAAPQPRAASFAEQVPSGGLNPLETLSIALRSLQANAMRSILTTLGIIIGVAAVVTLTSLGSGVTANITENLTGLGTNLLTISNNAGGGGPPGLVRTGGQQTVTLDDAETIAALGDPRIAGVAPSLQTNTQLKVGNVNMNATVVGTWPDYAWVRNSDTELGTFFSHDDLRTRKRVAVIGFEVATELYGAEDPVGQRITIQGVSFTVVGVLPDKGAGFGSSNSNVFHPAVDLSAAARSPERQRRADRAGSLRVGRRRRRSQRPGGRPQPLARGPARHP